MATMTEYNASSGSGMTTPIIAYSQINNLIEDGDIKYDSKINLPNIYTTVDNAKYNFSGFGNSFTLIENYPEYKFTQLDSSPVNIRLLINNSTQTNHGVEMMKINNFTSINDYIFVPELSEPLNYSGKYIQWSQDGNKGFYADNDYFLTYKKYMVSNASLKDIFLRITSLLFIPATEEIDIYSKLTGVSYSKIKPKDNTPAGEDYEESIWTKGYSSKYGYLIGVSGVSAYYGKISGERSFRLTPINGSESEYNISILCEKRINNTYYYYTPPFLQYSRLQNSLTNLSILQLGRNTETNTFYQSNFRTSQFFNEYVNSVITLDDINDYNRGLTPYIINADNVEYVSDFGKAYVKGNLVYAKASQAAAGDVVVAVITPLQDIFRCFASTLLPFSFSDYFNNKRTFDDEIYCGIRNEDTGFSEGDFIQGEAINNLEDDFIPEYFTPYDPDEEEDNPVSPDDFGDVPMGSLPPDLITSFTKYYVFDAIGVDSMGSNLWGKMLSYTQGENNMVDNFFFLKYIKQLTDSSNYDVNLTLSDVIDYFVSLKYYPIPYFNEYLKGRKVDSIKVGTGVTPIEIANGTCYIPSYQIFKMNGGRLYFEEIKSKLYGNFIDYEPNVSATLYVPYCGTYELQPSTIFDNSMSYIDITYCIDIATGMMTAIVYKNGNANFPIACLQGQIGFEIPISGNNANSVNTSARINGQNFFRSKQFSLLGSLIPSPTMNKDNVAGQIASYLNKGITKSLSTISEVANYLNGYPLVTGTSPIVVGSADSLASCIMPQVAYLQVVRHSTPNNLSYPTKYSETYGFVKESWENIGSLNGFIKCANPRLEGIPCNETERGEIYNLLTSGVYRV